jgi:threonylcarbamoyladenosine tRNA methylthiotransferase CDKAL1
MSRRVVIETYGCTLNQSDSEMMGALLEKEGYFVHHGKCDAKENYDYVILNTCTVKPPTEQKILHRINELKGYGNRLIVAGCMASANPDMIARFAPKAGIITTSNTAKISEALKCIESDGRAVFEKYSVIDKPAFFKANGSVIAKIIISEGCLGNCSFCETKFARGPLHSFSESAILNAVEAGISKGAKEIELTSQDCGAYGLDKKTNIAELVNRVSNLDGDFKIRIGMLNPEHLHRYFDELLKAYKYEKVYKFIHLPVQSGNDRVLHDMNRNYTTNEFEEYVAELRRKFPMISLETDIIVGYPTESVQEFEDSIELIKRLKPVVTNVSKFGTRPHARASTLKQLSSQEVKRRSIEMSSTVKFLQTQLLRERLGTVRRVLLTERNEMSFAGRDESYLAVAVKGTEGLSLGDFVEVNITGNTFAYLIGCPTKYANER